MSVLQQTVSLAAQLRAFSSLLSLPSQAQSVIKALRRQGIGFADVFNTARFLLSRLESLSALLQVFQIFRGRAELAASRPMARQCLPCQPSYSRLFVPPFRRLPLQPQTRLTLASALWPLWFLVTVVPVAERPLSPVSTFIRPPPAADYVLASYGICGQFPHLHCRRENRPQTP